MPETQPSSDSPGTGSQSLLDELLESARHTRPDKLEPMLGEGLQPIPESVREFTDSERFVSSLAAVMFNLEVNLDKEAGEEAIITKQRLQKIIEYIDELTNVQLREVYADPKFKELERCWRSVEDLVATTDFSANVKLSLLDVSKEEIFEDLEMNSADIGGAEMFKKLYVAEYDQYGGEPFGGVMGMYEFDQGRKDMLWLETMGKIATACHAPFIGAVKPQFFGCESMAEMNQLRDLTTMLGTPKYKRWNRLRESEEAAYIGLVLPRVMLRPPYDDVTYPADDISFNEIERAKQGDDDGYLWGTAVTLFARNLVRSFSNTGWCQYIRGPRSGGQIENLATHEFELRGENQTKTAVEITMPDFREYELARAGFIPLIQKKGAGEAAFYSAQSIKKSEVFKDPKDSENSQLVTNLAYTYSITRIAHYLKCIMRDNIGSAANALSVQNQIDRWIAGFTTALVNPDDLTLRYYPFKAYSLEVVDVPGKVGWYHCNLSILPHVQFEGLDVDLRIDARLGA